MKIKLKIEYYQYHLKNSKDWKKKLTILKINEINCYKNFMISYQIEIKINKMSQNCFLAK